MVHVEDVAGAEQWFAPLLNPHRPAFVVADHEVEDLMDRLIQKASELINRFIVHADKQRAAELVETEFDPVFFQFTYLKIELHRFTSCALTPAQILCRSGKEPQSKFSVRIRGLDKNPD